MHAVFLLVSIACGCRAIIPDPPASMTENPAASLHGIRAVILDLDGTLVDSAGEIAIALNRTLAELERAPFPRHEVEALIGRGVRSLVERALRIARVTSPGLDEV